MYESLGPCKCVNVPLGALTDAQPGPQGSSKDPIGSHCFAMVQWSDLFGARTEQGSSSTLESCLPSRSHNNFRAPRSAELFLKRIHRPLRPCDLDHGAQSQGNLTKTEGILQKLAKHPVLRQIGGNPGQVNAICQRVTPQLKSLWDLCSTQWQRLESVTTSVVRSMSFDFETRNPNIQNESRLMRRMSDDLDEHQSSLQLTRKP